MVTVLTLAVLAVVAAGQQLLTRLRPASCAVVGISGGWFGFEPERLANASTIAGLAVKRRLPSRAAVIAIATAMQESKLQNLRHGDRDSLGLFQQRPSQGWGTPEQILNPVFATNSFYDRLVRVPGYLTRPLTQVAQAVQLSGFPEAYGRHEAEATVLADALTGARPAAVTCRLEPTVLSRRATQLAKDLRDEWGLSAQSAAGVDEQRAEQATVPGAGATIVVAATSSTQAWAVGAWAVAHAERHGIDLVRVGRHEWTRGMSTEATQWQERDPSVQDTEVRIRLPHPPGGVPPVS